MSALEKIALSEIMASKIGSVDPSKFQDEVFDLYSIPAFDRGKPEVIEGSKIGSAKQIVQPGDVLLSKIVPHIRRSWIVGESRGRRLIGSGEWIVFRSEKVHPEYLRHVLVADPFHVQFMSTVSGVGGSLLRARPAQVAGIEIPIPPLDEQRRIAAILDKADTIRRKRQESIRLTEEFLRSTFLELFGDPVTNSKGWDEIRLEDIADIQSGITKGRKLNGQKTLNVPYMRVANVQDGHLVLDEIKEIEATPIEIERFRLLLGDILLTEGGDPDKLGRGAVWQGVIPLCIHQNHIFRVRPKADQALPKYLSALISSARGKQYFLGAAKQTTGIASINKTQLCNFPALLPPIDLQRKFGEIVRKTEAVQERFSSISGLQGDCFNSLTHRAFRGEL